MVQLILITKSLAPLSFVLFILENHNKDGKISFTFFSSQMEVDQKMELWLRGLTGRGGSWTIHLGSFRHLQAEITRKSLEICVKIGLGFRGPLLESQGQYAVRNKYAFTAGSLIRLVIRCEAANFSVLL